MMSLLVLILTNVYFSQSVRIDTNNMYCRAGRNMQGIQWLVLLTGGLYGAELRNRTEEPARQERTFSLFSIVQFPNQACSSTSGTYGNGSG